MLGNGNNYLVAKRGTITRVLMINGTQDGLVMDKWFSLQAMSPATDVLQTKYAVCYHIALFTFS